jgi:hypothetical protein
METASNGWAAILILGMHRSGTSARARVLNLLGAEFPEGLLGPGYGNTLGHWEPEQLMKIDEPNRFKGQPFVYKFQRRRILELPFSGSREAGDSSRLVCCCARSSSRVI